MRRMINVNEKNYERIRELATENKTTITTVLNQAIETYLLFEIYKEKQITRKLKNAKKNS